MKLFYCTNTETLESLGVSPDFDRIWAILHEEELFLHLVPVPCNDFHMWNGGSGNGKLAFLSLENYGPVHNLEDAWKGAGWLAQHGQDFPGSQDLEKDFRVLEEVRDLMSGDPEP